MSENYCDCGCIYLEAECPNCNRQDQQHRIEELEAKLSEAVKALDETRIILAEHEPHPLPVLAKVLATLANIKSQGYEFATQKGEQP